MSAPTLGLLEHLQPPVQYRTVAAIGTSFSADLLTCMTVLTTLDGGEGEDVQYGRVEAFRALDRLRDRVRIYHHTGRLSRRDGAKYPSLALLDRILVPIAPTGYFHPKVWVVRQQSESGEQRFVLIVSSRNITTSTDWDLGVALTGRLVGRGVQLPKLGAFVEHVARLSRSELPSELGNLSEVRWTLPPGANGLEFDFQAGGADKRELHAAWTRFPREPKRVLLISPFIDAHMIELAASRWGSVSTRKLVAGREGLARVALTGGREALLALRPYEVASASESAEPLEPSDSPEEEQESSRGLHAKVVVVDDGRSATILVGSNNLTGAGWCGSSTEAFVRIVGDAALANPLFEWASSNAHEFEPPPVGAPAPEEPRLDALVEMLSGIAWCLREEPDARASRLFVASHHALSLPVGVTLHVCRYSTPEQRVAIVDGATEVVLAPCADHQRTRFLVLTLSDGDEEASWIASAELDPPLGSQRDRALVAKLLGVRGFLAYLRSLGAEVDTSGPIEGSEPGDGHAIDGLRGVGSIEDVSLEGLLRQVAEKPASLARLDEVVQRYGELLRREDLTSEDGALLQRFLDVWAAIREGFGP